jgi:hypothetical protein
MSTMLAERQIQCRQLSADNDRLLVSALLEFPGRPIMLTRAAWVLRQKGISATTDAAFKEMLTARGQAQDALALLDIEVRAQNKLKYIVWRGEPAVFILGQADID